MRTAFRKPVSILLLAACAAGVDAAEWEIDPTITFRTGYTDNLRLNVDDKVSTAEVKLSPSAKFSVATPESGVSGNLRFDFRRFEDDSNLDDNNVRLITDAYHRMERSSLGLNLGLIKDTTLDSQLENTGLVFERVTRYQVNGGPSWTYNLDNRTNARVSYTYSDIQYNNTEGTAFTDFRIHSGVTTLRRVLSEKSDASATLSYNQTSNDNKVDTNNTNLQGGGSYRFSETLSASLFVGVRRTGVDFSQSSLIPIFSGETIIGFIPLTEDVSRSDWGYTFDGNISKVFLRGQARLSASRNISNDVNGLPIEITRAGWNNTYRFSETLSGSLIFSFSKSETSNNARGGLNRDFYQVEPGLSWNFSKLFYITGSYTYSRQTFDTSSDDAIRNAAYLTLTYQWPRIAVSR